MSKEKRRVPKLRFPGFTEDWEQCKLSVLATMNARIGWQNLRTSEFLDNGDYLLITGTDFDNGRIKYSTCHYVEKKRFDQDTKIQLSTGSILITKDGTLGKVALVEELPKPATLNAGVFNVRVKDDAFLSYKYLYHYLKAPFLMKYVTANATGGTIKHLNQSILVDFPIPITGKQEQDRIAKLLDSLESIITLHQRKLNNLKLKKKALLQKLFPKNEERYPELRFPGFTDAWEQRKLESLFTKYEDKVSTPDSGYWRLGLRSHCKGTFYTYVDAGHELETTEMYRVKAGNFILNITFAWERALAVTDDEDQGKLVSHRFPQFKPNDDLVIDFFKHTLMDKRFKHHLELSSPGGAGRNKVLKVSDMLKYELLVPSIQEQNIISSFLNNVDYIITLHQRKLDHLQLQKKALLQQMFV